MVIGVADLPLGFRVSGTGRYQSGTPYSAHDANIFGTNCPRSTTCPAPRAIINGSVVDRNTLRNESLSQLDIRAAWVWNFRDSGELEIFAEVFNLFNQTYFTVNELGNKTMNPFDVTNQQMPFTSDGSANPEYKIPDEREQVPRFIQFGVRVRI